MLPLLLESYSTYLVLPLVLKSYLADAVPNTGELEYLVVLPLILWTSIVDAAPGTE